MRQKIIFLLVILILGAGAAGWWWCAQARAELARLQQAADISTYNGKVASFLTLFTSHVLGGKSEVDFETRLKLENSIRDIGDQDLLVQWRRFVDSPSEEVAQEEVKNLLVLLSSKIMVE